jgi:vacuolar-type H+-ATPase subunit H
MSDREVIDRLLEVERNAASIVHEAELEAEKRIAEAVERQKKTFQDAYTGKMRELEAEHEAELARMREEKARRMKEFLERLASRVPNPRRLDDCLGEIIRKGMF